MEKLAKNLKMLIPVLALSLAVISAVVDFSLEMSQLKEQEKLKELPENNNS